MDFCRRQLLQTHDVDVSISKLKSSLLNLNNTPYISNGKYSQKEIGKVICCLTKHIVAMM